MSHSVLAGPSDVARCRLSVEIHGAVQGVGFRPFVYRLAAELGLCGWVNNDTAGVFIEVEGARETLERFLARLPAEIPPRAHIQSLDHAWLPPVNYDGFEIRRSATGGAKTALILPDIATCPECLAEILDPADRRFGYPFTNCTNCGPRFTIIQALPYDRPNTTMRRFTMCPQCMQEYDAPLDRRFHAQPNACPLCGPQIKYLECEAGQAAGDAVRDEANEKGDEALRRAAEAIRAGCIVAVKGLGGFHLMCDARNDRAVAQLRRLKPRPDRPFAIMAPSIEWVREHCATGRIEEGLLLSPEAPIVLLQRRPGGAGVSAGVAPHNPTLGVMLPYTPLHHLLMRELGFPVVATSGNRSDEPICMDEQEAFKRLKHTAGAFLVHDRPIHRHADDSVVQVIADASRLLRRARGYAPLPILLREAVPTILAVGPHLKNTVSLSVGRQVFTSQHIGDLETPEALEAFERVIADFLRLYDASPIAIAHDLHPDYVSTRWATEHCGPKLSLIPVQHHHAHLAACLAENQMAEPALGIAWDGTGYGADGTIWGGECLLGDAGGYERVAHLRPFVLPGGEAAVHEPWRVALALLFVVYGERSLDMNLPPLRASEPAARRVVAQMVAQGVNARATTSMGRLFDGVAALIGLPGVVTFEGQAAIRLEHTVELQEEGAYPMPLNKGILEWGYLVEAIVEDQRRATPVSIMAARFHNALVNAMVAVARGVGEGPGGRPLKVALTGGCFQNRVLVERGAAALRAAGFEVLLHAQTPPNDGCISLGQVAVAAARLRGDGLCV